MSYEGTKNIPRHHEQFLSSFKVTFKSYKLDQSYNIPISIYFSPNYPYTPPFVYIEPLPSMRIFKTQSVDLDGHVTHPLLSIWKYLIAALQIEFGNVPPIYQESPTCAVSESLIEKKSIILVTPACNFDAPSREWENIIINMQPIIYESLSELKVYANSRLKNNHAQHLNYSTQLNEGRQEIESKMKKIDYEQVYLRLTYLQYQLECYIERMGNEIIKLDHAS
ncbi:hypothetical protein MXB_903 [Myxobolus squamalis]|nr:hypothetical protein MXB_903 [Myxobolus squamalis]